MTPENGGPAFPLPLGTSNMAEPSQSGGMSLRDYFAAKAMQAYMSDSNVGWGRNALEDAASAAYRMADAMLVERAK